MPKDECLKGPSIRHGHFYHPYPRDIVDFVEPLSPEPTSIEPRIPIKYIHQLLNHDSEPFLAGPSQAMSQREPSSSPLFSPVPVSSSEDESDDEDGYVDDDDDDDEDDDDDSVAYEDILSNSAMLHRSPFDRSRGEVDVTHAIRGGSSLRRSVAYGLQSFLGETLPVIRASSSRHHDGDADFELARLTSSHSERVRESRTRNDISRVPYIVFFYGDEEEYSEDRYLVEEVTSEFLEIQDSQAVLRMEQLFDWWLLTLALDGKLHPRMSDFHRFVRRQQKIHFSTNSYPAYYKDCWREVRPLGTHTAYANGVPHIRTGCPWSVHPANPTHTATREACQRWKIDPDGSDIFVVFAVAEISGLLSPSVQPYQPPAPTTTAEQEDPHNGFYVVPPETRSFLYTSTSLRPPETASWIRSYHNPPPRHTWDTEFADVALILRKLQKRPYTTCYKHYAIVWFQHEMCKAMGIQAIYGSQGGMDDVADWLIEQKQAGIKLLGVKRSTIQNWKAKVYSNTESLYVKFKSFIEKGGRIPPESERLYITVKVWVTNDPGAMIDRGGFYTDEESIAMNSKGSGHLGAMTDEHFAAQVAGHLKPGGTWWMKA